MSKLFFNVDKLNVSIRDFHYMAVFSELLYGAGYETALYESLKQKYSKLHFYKKTMFHYLLLEMETKKLIQGIKQGRKKIYSITSEGEKMYKWYRENYQNDHEALLNYIRQFLGVFTRGKDPQPLFTPTHEQVKMFNRFIQVQVMVQCLFVRDLLLSPNKRLIGSEFLNSMEERFAWRVSNGYFYEILRNMEESDLIRGKWNNEHKRTTKTYFLTDRGEREYRRWEENLVFQLRESRRFLKEWVQVFGESKGGD